MAELSNLARQAKTREMFVAHRVAAYQRAHDLDDLALAAQLGCELADLTHLRLCALPHFLEVCPNCHSFPLMVCEQSLHEERYTTCDIETITDRTENVNGRKGVFLRWESLLSCKENGKSSAYHCGNLSDLRSSKSVPEVQHRHDNAP